MAPFYSDTDSRLNGRIFWEMYGFGDSQKTDEIIIRVGSFISTFTNSTGFRPNFVFVATWWQMHPYPAGQSVIEAEPYFEMVFKNLI